MRGRLIGVFLPSSDSLFRADIAFRVTWSERRSETFAAHSPLIRHRSELTEKAWEKPYRNQARQILSFCTYWGHQTVSGLIPRDGACYNLKFYGYIFIHSLAQTC